MAPSVKARLTLVELHLKDLRRHTDSMPSREVAWRMHAAEREMRIKAEVDAALAKQALEDYVRSMESLLAEAEGLVWFLKGSKQPA